MAKPLYIIKRDGQGSGGFLCPPGHPAHGYVVHGYWGGRVKPVSGPDLIAGLDYLITDEYGDVPAGIKASARRITDSAELTCSETWVRSVYGYFRDSYSPDGSDRNVSHAVSTGKLHCACGEDFWDRKGLDRHLSGLSAAQTYDHYEVAKPLPPAEHHLGYLCVREYFPDHTPRLDLIADPGRGYGSWPCDKCGQRVQYEARRDAWCVVQSMPWKWTPDCPEGGHHQVAPAAPATA